MRNRFIGPMPWAAGLVALAGASLLSCQSHELEATRPFVVGAEQQTETLVGKREKPFIMLVVDASGSMLDAAQGSGHCRDSGGYHKERSCKWNDLRRAFAGEGGFLREGSGLAHYGLAQFPTEEGRCAAGTILRKLDLESDNADAIAGLLDETIVPNGGTPTAATLRSLLANDPLLATAQENRSRFVMLLTDGLPNCSDSDEMRAKCQACRADEDACNEPTGCRPTYGSTRSCTEPEACLDDQGLVAAIADLKAAGVETFVIGFGSETAEGEAARVLNAAAEAGGRPRANAEVAYYQADDGDELRAVLAEISQVVQRCLFSLDPPPSSKSMLQVVLHDKVTGEDDPFEPETEWKFVDETKLDAIELLPQACEELQEADPKTKELRFYYVVTSL